MRKYRIIIAGGRDFNNLGLLALKMDHLLQNIEDRSQIEIVSGKARGADFIGEKYAEMHGLPVKEFPAEWDEHGKAAGVMRNAQMAEYATHLVALWNGQSKGTAHMIETAKKKGLIVRVYYYFMEELYNNNLKTKYKLAKLK